ncbi:MAG: rRNA maturation RNase YbeY [Hominisplanchenecus sp.]|nr:rRNA maturation RNase YbeY [Lachnospiraceae bacterium]MDY2820208.1 rRNA maturation RNase YbeY [Hominisplanchenecus sp.]
MTLNYETEYDGTFPFDPKDTAERVLEFTMDYLGCPYEADVNLLLTDDDAIHEINKEQRGIDRATDVLSFPMEDYPTPGDFTFLEEVSDCFHPESGELLLGDIVISGDRVVEQAENYGHSTLREFAFLMVHSLLHLMGYDHMEPEDAKIMEKKQAEILDSLGIKR